MAKATETVKWTRTVAAALLCAALAVGAAADTVFLKDGTQLDGKVSRPNDNSVALEVGKARLVFEAHEVLRIEKNDRTGEDQLDPLQLAARRRQARLEDRTGLTAEERERVRDLMKPLLSDKPTDRAEARARLAELGKEIDVFQYLSASLPYLSSDFVPEVMQTLVEIDPKRAGDVVKTRMSDAEPVNRAQAVRLLGASGDPAAAQDIARGLADDDPGVRAAAATGLADLGAREATPALLKGLSSPYREVQRSCRDALNQLWADAKGAAPGLQTKAQWQALWNSRRSEVDNPIDTAGLQPLYTPPADGVEIHHDE
jgi:HEAT repeat protein